GDNDDRAGARLRAAVAAEQPLQMVGTINAYVARMAEATGYRAIYLSGGGLAANSLGLPDLGISTMDDVATEVARICEATRLPQQELVDRIKAAVDARSDHSFVVMARTDALAAEGEGPAIERLRACVEAGADMVFPEAVGELAQYQRIRAAVGVPVLANLTEFGRTPLFTREQLAGAGVDIALYCCAVYRAMNAAALATLQEIRTQGTQAGVLARMQTRDELYRYLGYHDYEAQLDTLFAQGRNADK
ncbi:MAG: methylisocitrate lyase, partial [Pseudomonadota bacterium]